MQGKKNNNIYIIKKGKVTIHQWSVGVVLISFSKAMHEPVG